MDFRWFQFILLLPYIVLGRYNTLIESHQLLPPFQIGLRRACIWVTTQASLIAHLIHMGKMLEYHFYHEFTKS